MAQDLNEYLATRQPKGFSSVPQYFEDGDFVTYFLKNDLHYAQRVDGLLTIYLSEESDELIGCKIKGVREILETMGAFGVVIADHNNEISLGLLFLTAAAFSSASRERYLDIAKKVGAVRLKREWLPQLQAVAA